VIQKRDQRLIMWFRDFNTPALLFALIATGGLSTGYMDKRGCGLS
jgi:hypothetical protein